MNDDSAIATLEPPVESEEFDLEAEIQQITAGKTRLGEDAIRGYNSLLVRQTVIQERRTTRRGFCESRGVNLDQATEFITTQHEQQKKAEPAGLSTEESFILTTATGRPGEGFTMEELPALVEAAGLGDMKTKETRQPFFQAVLSLEAKGLLKKADIKRESKTVYVAAHPTK